MLSPATTALIKATVPALQQHGEQITNDFYATMLNDYPELKAYFNQAHQATGTQARALSHAVIAYAMNIDRLEALADALPRIVQKHAALDIRPEHYPIVGACLLGAIKRVLGSAATDAIIDAWAQGYQQLADILIPAEEQVYREKAGQSGGWRGPRCFRVVRKQAESTVITSFYFEPVDGRALMTFAPGQYITVLLTVDGQRLRRTYSLSDAPGQPYYRISVKREPSGLASNHLHEKVSVGDVVELLAPGGDFTLRGKQHDRARPLVLVTAGVGITPAISMLNAAAASGRRIEFIHAAINGDVHAFREHVEAIAAQHPNVRPYFIYSNPRPHEQPHATGYITAALLAARLPESDVDLYFLGPKPFMRAMHRTAQTLNIPPQQVHYEFFGPLEELSADPGPKCNST